MASSDVEQLHRLGYAQELRRGMKTFSNFAVSFTIISILSGCLTLFKFGMLAGGPAVMTIGWLVVGVFVIFVALGMAEVASSYPTAGGLYYWAAKLADEAGRNGARWSWFVGWFNLIGQVAVTAGIDFGLSLFTQAFLNYLFGYPTDAPYTILIYGIVLIIHALLNTFGIRVVQILNDLSVWWHLVGVGAIVIVAVVLNQHARTDIGTVFSTFVDRTGSTPDAGWPGPMLGGIALYVVLIGLLNAQYTLTGYDASAHMSEETHDAARSAPKGIIYSVIVSVIAGFILLVAMNIGITPDSRVPGDGRRHGHHGQRLRPRLRGARSAGPDLDRCRRPDRRPGHPVPGDRRPVLLRDVVGHREFADDLRVRPRRRDPRQQLLAPDQPPDPDADELDLAGRRRRVHPGRAVLVEPGRLLRDHVDRRHRPVRRLRRTGVPARPGRLAASSPAHGRSADGVRSSARSRPSGSRSSCVLFMLPQYLPQTDANGLVWADINFTPVVFIVVLGGAAIWYAVSAKNWFKGPKVQGTPEELAAIEQDLEII